MGRLLLLTTAYQGGGVEKIDTDLQNYKLEELETTDTTQNMENLYNFFFSPWELSNTRTSCLERLPNLHLLQYSGLRWTRP